MRFVAIVFILFQCFNGFAQVYFDDTLENARHRFAQTLVGADMQFSSGGKSFFMNENTLQPFNIGPQISPRITFSGMHFWGRAEFYISIPLGSVKLQPSENVEYRYNSGFETGARVYAYQVKKKKITPFAGASFNALSYRQNTTANNGVGPVLHRAVVPVNAGVVFMRGDGIVELGAAYNFTNRFSYYAARTQAVEIQLPALHFWAGYKHILDITLPSEKPYRTGETQKRVDELASRGRLNAWSVSMGPSNSFFTSKSAYNEEVRPFLHDYKVSGIYPEFGLGFYHHKLDAHINLAYRGFRTNLIAYGVEQGLNRQAVNAEIYKFLFDYHGFVPFIGAAYSREKYTITETDVQTASINYSEVLYTPGIVAGWDIRPDRLQSFILRSNIRYFPGINLNVPNAGKFSLNQLEFNFIQLVIYPNRLFL